MRILILTSMILSSSFCFSITKEEKETIVHHFIIEQKKCFEKQHYDETNQRDFFYYLGCCHTYHEMINYVDHLKTDEDLK